MKQYLKLKLSQKLSPQQIQLMKLIQLPTLDFEQKIQREIEENPALEHGQNSNDDNQQENQDDFSDSEDINILQDRIELLHRLISFSAVSILGTLMLDELMLPEARWDG